jgi:predicted nucleotidyltransferase
MAKAAADVASRVQVAVEFLRVRIELAQVFLFGSHADGRADDWSDIDLAVFSPDAASMTLVDRAGLATDLQLACGLELEPHFFPATALENPEPGSFVRHILETGKRVV